MTPFRLVCPTVALLVFLFLFSSCRNKPLPCGDPPPAFVRIILTDQHDSLLVGKKYNPDSISLMANHEKISLSVEKGIITLHYAGLEKYNSENYWLTLSKTDTDTLRLTVTKHSGSCWDYDEFSNLVYNSATVSPVSYDKFVFKIVKP